LSIDPKFFDIYFAQTVSSHEAICISNQGDIYFYYLLIKGKIIICILYMYTLIINKFIYENFNINLIFTINVNLNYF